MSHSGRCRAGRRWPIGRSLPWVRALGGGLALTLGVVAFATGPAGAAEHTAEHKVRPGETLGAIAKRYGVSTTELARLNQLRDPNLLLVGAVLRFPGSGGGPAPATRAAPGAASGASAAPATGGPAFDIDEAQRRETARLLERAAAEFSVPATLLMALTYTESRWRQDAVSSSGAIGVGQLLPETAAWMAGVMGEPRLDVRDREDNIRMSARLLRFLLDRTASPTHALASYYQGIGAVLKSGLSPAGARYAGVITSRRSWFS